MICKLTGDTQKTSIAPFALLTGYPQLLICVSIDNTPWGVYTSGMKTSTTKIVRRLKIIEGQVRGLRDMVEKGEYCIDIITQSSAAKQGLSNVEDILMEGHLAHCVVEQIQEGSTKKAIGEILKVYKLKRK